MGSAVNSAIIELEEAVTVEYEDPTIDDEYVYVRQLGGGRYYHDLLTEKQQNFYRKIRIDVDRFFMGEKETKPFLVGFTKYEVLGHYRLSDYGLTLSEALQAFDALYQDCPQYYAYNSTYLLGSEEMLSPVMEKSFLEQTARDQMDAKIAKTVSEISTFIKDYHTDFEKFSILYDYVKTQVRYAFNIFGMPSMRSHTGNLTSVLDGDPKTNSICAGYSFALTYLCNIFEVECLFVGNLALNHAWNVVKMDGAWYYADATNDDAVDTDELFLCSEQTFWTFFECDQPQYDDGEPTTMGRKELLPPVSQTLAYSRFEWREETDGYAAVRPLVDQAYIKIPAKYNGKPVVKICAGFMDEEVSIRQLVIPSSIQAIESGALSQEMVAIYFEGSEEAFAAVNIEGEQAALAGVSVYYYSETKPPRNHAKYWRYNNEGFPCLWSEWKGGNTL